MLLQLSSRVWQRCRVRYLHQVIWLSTEHHMRVSINAPGWGSVVHHPPKLGCASREGSDLKP